ncbi:hypothetical protein BaRGS_00007901 [Batillaria attramentaria]|uniref:Secreted protein n=1 Tax=Batillaria attramentaria TaxID=370345 RepID=A0ABD0LP50_9CAEN
MMSYLCVVVLQVTYCGVTSFCHCAVCDIIVVSQVPVGVSVVVLKVLVVVPRVSYSGVESDTSGCRQRRVVVSSETSRGVAIDASRVVSSSSVL